MSLLDRYIHAVKRHLPKGQQDDIAAELRDTIQSQIEAEEATHGRAITEDEEAVILKRFGRPLTVAARYGSPEYLIGPTLFPYYWFVLKVLVWIGAPLLIFAAVVSALASANPLAGVAEVLRNAITMVCVAFAVVTLVFWQMGRRKLDMSQDWDPRELPKLPESSKVIPRTISLNGAIVMTVYLLWWVDLLPINLGRLVGWDAASAPLQFGPAWQAIYTPIAVLLAIDIALQWINVWKPRVTKWRVAAGIVTDLAGLAVIYYLVQADELLVVTRGARFVSADRLSDIATVGLVLLGVLIAIGLIDEFKRLFATDVQTIRTVRTM